MFMFCGHLTFVLPIVPEKKQMCPHDIFVKWVIKQCDSIFCSSQYVFTAACESFFLLFLRDNQKQQEVLEKAWRISISLIHCSQLKSSKHDPAPPVRGRPHTPPALKANDQAKLIKTHEHATHV